MTQWQLIDGYNTMHMICFTHKKGEKIEPFEKDIRATFMIIVSLHYLSYIAFLLLYIETPLSRKL